MIAKTSFSASVLDIDPAAEAERICASLREICARRLRRRGFVVGVSGGIDSSVTLALCARAVGSGRTLALQMPERDSAPETESLGELAARHAGVRTRLEDITPLLEAAGFYRRFIEAANIDMPEYGEGWKSKLVIANVLDRLGYSTFSLVARSPEGRMAAARLGPTAYLGIVAATNFKQRIRKMLEYYHADRLNYAVAGTPNRLEYDQGFFVKLGDGAADVKPIAHLYKTQVYRLAEHLGIPEEIRSRPPTTDTYSLAQGQDEFYFSLPYDKMDLCLYGESNGVDPEEIGPVVGLSAEQVGRVYGDIERKREATLYLHMAPCIIGEA